MNGRRVRRAGAIISRAGARLALACALVAPAATAEARSAAVVPYPITDVWPATVRFLRVDQSYAIKEKDEPAGYLLFELVEGKRAYRAALELVKTTDADGRIATQIVCTMNDLPHRYETTLLDKLGAKIRDERGPPPPPPARKAPAKDKEKDAPPPSGAGGAGLPNDLPRAPTIDLPPP